MAMDTAVRARQELGRTQVAQATWMELPTRMSVHARQRGAQRGISPVALGCAMEHGRIVHAAGARFLFLGRQQIAEACACGADRRTVEKCSGLVVLVANDGRVITTYRNARALADIRRKKPYDRRDRR